MFTKEGKARGREVGERVVNALDERIERRGIAGVQLQSNGLRSRTEALEVARNLDKKIEDHLRQTAA